MTPPRQHPCFTIPLSPHYWRKPTIPEQFRHSVQACMLNEKPPSPNVFRRHFVNLSNGAEGLDLFRRAGAPSVVRFTRIQSSHCEAGAYDALLRGLDTELLLNVAMGHECYIYDFASRERQRGVPRAIFLGVAFVKWALSYLWLGGADSEKVPDVVLVRGRNLVPYWKDHVMQYVVDKKTKKQLRYYKSFAEEMGTEEVKLFGVYGRPALYDGQIEVYARMVADWMREKREDEQNENEVQWNKWLQLNGLAVYDETQTADELRLRQNWMKSVNTDVSKRSTKVL